LPCKDPQRQKQYDRELYLKNKETILQEKKVNREKDPEKYRLRCRLYYQKNKAQILGKKKQRRVFKPKGEPKYLSEGQRGKIRRQQLILVVNKYKDIPCGICRIQLPSICMDFHHIDSTKKINTIGTLITKKVNINIILNEIKKCIVVCANCHFQLGIKDYNSYPEWFIEYRENLRCEKCEINKSLEFHHYDPSTKLYKISYMVIKPRRFSKEIIMNEIKKCKVLCRCCHRLEHWN
jgi:hypothetical protein